MTGGAGYIGSHTVVALLEKGFDCVIIDNFSNSSPEAVSRIEEITGKNVTLVEGDVCDEALVERIFSEHNIDAVIHFAGLKAVGESAGVPLSYYQNNLQSTLSLLSAMKKHNVSDLVFSSSATVYHDESVNCYEEATTKTDRPSSPYGTTKLMQEWVLEDATNGQEFTPGLKVISLRYFNPTGAHPSGKIGEDPSGIPNNLTPFIAQVVVGRRERLSIWGNDYPTPDGTCIRDYIHVQDLAKGHVLALEYLQKGGTNSSFDVFNLGSGVGYSVLEVLHAFEKANGAQIPYVFAPRRAGDLPEYFAKTTKAERALGFHTSYSLDDMARDTLNWQRLSPNGYRNS